MPEDVTQIRRTGLGSSGFCHARMHMRVCWEGREEVLHGLLSEGGQRWSWGKPRGVFLLQRAEESAGRSRAGFVSEGQGWELGTGIVDTAT